MTRFERGPVPLRRTSNALLLGLGAAISAALAYLAISSLPLSRSSLERDSRFSTAMAAVAAYDEAEPALPRRHFASAGDFSEGLAPVQVDGGFGFMDTAGILRIPPRYAYAGGFSCNRAPVLEGGKWGYVDAAGREAIPPVFDWGGRFSGGLAPVATSRGYGFIDSNGAPVGAGTYTDARNFSEGFAAVRTGDGENAAWGFIDRKGVEAIPPLFPDVPGGFSEGLAVVRVESERPFRSGFIDSSGGFAIDTLYDAAGDFSEGLAPVGKGDWRGDRFHGIWGYVDRTGRMAIAPAFESATGFRNGRALVRVPGSGFRLIGRDGRILVSYPAGIELAALPDGDMVTFKVRNRYGFMDSSGKEIIPPVFSEAGRSRLGWARARIGGGERGAWVFIDREGRFLGDVKKLRLVEIPKIGPPQKTAYTAGVQFSMFFQPQFRKKQRIRREISEFFLE